MPDLDSVYERFHRARTSMMQSRGSLRERLQGTRDAFAELDAKDFPSGLRGEFEAWVRTWFDAESIDELGWDTSLADGLDDSEVNRAVRKLTDEMWAKVKTDYYIHNPHVHSDPHYDWGE